MRNYIDATVQRVWFHQGSNDPFSSYLWFLGTDDGDMGSIRDRTIAFMIENDPTTVIDGQDSPYTIYAELNLRIICRMLAVVFPLWNGTSSPPAFDDGMDLGPTFFFEHIDTDSPRKTWSHGH